MEEHIGLNVSLKETAVSSGKRVWRANALVGPLARRVIEQPIRQLIKPRLAIQR